MKAILLLFASAVLAVAETVTFTPSLDSDVYAYFDAPSFTPDSLNVGAHPTQAHSHHSLVQFNISTLAIPAAEIGTAKLRLFSLIPNSSNGGGLRGGNVSVHRQGQAWSLSPTLRWNHIKPQELAGTITMTAASTEVWVEVDVTTLVKQWAAGTVPNYGFVLKPESETLEPLLNVEFASMELTSFKPQLVITRSTAPVPNPVLSIAKQGNQITLAWPVTGSTGWTLQEADNLSGPWTASTATPASSAGVWQVSATAGSRKFFRLYKP
ncbi:DNRLRE domain-containing protein [Luteolibacter sp. GHJ8]|uniref:DNRLRE domain-containing protein n=1 Tax=Luteolibacter rhizosphaerae TaxID=2989719 RepID=A0ABT3GB11_9BACT|nr:DNRLRE domain-containing protein [Luteolibacter rhizosphaerae]MCW1917020.1 DNRLRE domain-containing protein [Luteolibacter rhizosphaerae]